MVCSCVTPSQGFLCVDYFCMMELSLASHADAFACQNPACASLDCDTTEHACMHACRSVSHARSLRLILVRQLKPTCIFRIVFSDCEINEKRIQAYGALCTRRPVLHSRPTVRTVTLRPQEIKCAILNWRPSWSGLESAADLLCPGTPDDSPLGELAAASSAVQHQRCIWMSS